MTAQSTLNNCRSTTCNPIHRQRTRFIVFSAFWRETGPPPAKYFYPGLRGFTAFFENRLCAYIRIFPFPNPIRLSKNTAGHPSPLRRIAHSRHPAISLPPCQAIFTQLFTFNLRPGDSGMARPTLAPVPRRGRVRALPSRHSQTAADQRRLSP
jgi:hypothetical protein